MIETSGVIEKEQGNGFYLVTLEQPEGHQCLCRAAGKLTKFRIKLLAGDKVLVDGFSLDIQIENEGIIKGDQKYHQIMAASIIAKVTRDEIMRSFHYIYPEYDFKSNNGYGTKKHLEALKKYSFTPIHRLTFKPISSNIK